MKLWKFNILTNSELAGIKNDAFFQGTGKYNQINLEVLEVTKQLLGYLKRAHHGEYPLVWPWELCEKAEKIIDRASKG